MLVLGLSGGISFPYQNLYDIANTYNHDAAAVLIEDGNVAAAIEEERLNRIKHTNKAPLKAMKFCLDSCGADIDDVDKIAIFSTESSLNNYLKMQYVNNTNQKEFLNARETYLKMISGVFGKEIDSKKLCFVHHHDCHAVSAYQMSGFASSLVMTIDLTGDGISGIIEDCTDKEMKPIFTTPNSMSIGWFYNQIIRYLAYSQFDEYKVMGLAPYGDPSRYREIFKNLYSLQPKGMYSINGPMIPSLFDISLPRRKDEPFTQTHKDIAAALQESIEELVIHVLKYYREKTGHTKLCLSGGVAHNCSLNGKILYSGLFEDVFVQPASHDAGCALGAALHAYGKISRNTGVQTMKHVYWGTDAGCNTDILKTLDQWQNFIDYDKVDDITGKAAKLIADRQVIGWVQGRSEFGPRALGNRSIVADPRYEENKDIINAMVKKREAYRPFAPSVLEEYVDEYFVVPENKKDFPYMLFVLDVKKDKQHILGATTHVDGTARIQTVSKSTNPKYWDLINEFRKITGIPVLLNTSFNNNAEPIVDSVYDAVVCFLTTKLNYLVAGDYLVSKKNTDYTSYLDLAPSLPIHVSLTGTKRFISYDETKTFYEIQPNYDSRYNTLISDKMYDLLSVSDGTLTLTNLLEKKGFIDDTCQKDLVAELLKLWAMRMVLLSPVSRGFSSSIISTS